MCNFHSIDHYQLFIVAVTLNPNIQWLVAIQKAVLLQCT